MTRRVAGWAVAAYAAYELLANRITTGELLAGVPVALAVAGFAGLLGRQERRVPARLPVRLPVEMVADCGRLAVVLARATAGRRPRGRMVVEPGPDDAATIWAGSAAATGVVLGGDGSGRLRVHRLGRE